MTEPTTRALAEPWVGATSVARAYRSVQQRPTRGRDKRPIGDRNLYLLAFVVGHIDPRGNRPTFAERMVRWNALGIPEGWRYADPRRFHRDFNRARDALRFDRDDFLSSLPNVREEGWSPPARSPGTRRRACPRTDRASGQTLWHPASVTPLPGTGLPCVSHTEAATDR